MPLYSQIVTPPSPGSNGTSTPGTVPDGISSLLNLPDLNTTTGVPKSTAPAQFNALQLAAAQTGTGAASVLTSPGGNPVIASAGVLGAAFAVATHNGVQGSAALNANAAVSLVTAPGVSVTVQANAGAQASGLATVNSSGLHLSGAVGASATASTTAAYSSDLGSAGKVTAGAMATTGVVAVTAGSATIDRSGLEASASGFAGAKSSASAGGNYTGEGVTAGAGVAGFAPGSVGSSASFSALNQDGYVGINAAVTLDVGLGGLSLNFQFGLNTTDIKNDLLTGATATLGAFQQFGSALPSTVNDPNPFIRGLFGGTYTAYQNASADFNTAASALTSAATTVANGLTSAVSTLETGVDQAISTIGSAFSTVETAVVSGANTVGSFIQNVLHL